MDDPLQGVWPLFEAVLRHQTTQDERLDQLEKLCCDQHSQIWALRASTGRLHERNNRLYYPHETMDEFEARRSQTPVTPDYKPERGETITIIKCAHVWLPGTYWTHECGKCGVVEPLQPKTKEG